MTLSRNKKIILSLLIITALAAVALSQFSLSAEIARRITKELESRGFSDVEISISSVDTTHITFTRFNLVKDQIAMAANDVTLHAPSLPYTDLLQGKMGDMAGSWSVKSLVVTGVPYAIPALAGDGTWQFKDQAPQIHGALDSNDKTYHAKFDVNSKEILLQTIHLPWQGATISSENIRIALGANQPVCIALHVKNLPLSTLLSLVSSDKASGTGVVSGSVPVIIAPDGTITLGVGKLAAEKDGMISLAPSAIPGSGPQIEMARTALANFHYNHLSLTTAISNEGMPIIHLILEGNNPEAFKGRPIKLMVNLSGDVLETVQGTLMMMNNPKKWIQQEQK